MTSTMTTTTTTTDRAEPILASHLVQDAELVALLDDVLGSERRLDADGRGKERLGTGCESVDRALEGGIEGGCLVGVGCDADGVGGEICLALLANSLLLHPTSSAAVIDTTGNVNIPRLYTQIVHRLRSDAALLQKNLPVRSGDGGGHATTVEDLAVKVLERVKIMRVFDFVGVVEAVDEIREGLEGVQQTTAGPSAEPEDTNEDAVEEAAEESEQVVPPQRTRKTVIADSEDEDEEILFDAEGASPLEEAMPVPTHLETKQSNPNPNSPTSTKTTFILIDNLPHIINPLLKKDYTHTQAQTSTLLQTLTTLTQTHTLHTLLLNPCAAPRPRPNNNHQYPPSIFPSNPLLPTLPNLLSPPLDLHLLVSRIPSDPPPHAGGNSSSGGAVTRSALLTVKKGGRGRGGRAPGDQDRDREQMGGVLEVLADRWEGRVGGWGVF